MVLILLTLLILFLPIPIKLKLESFNKDYDIYLYSFSIKKLIKKNLENKKEPKVKTKTKTILNKSGFLNSLKNNKFKVKLKFSFILDYGLDDAFLVAMIFPFLNSISSFLFFILEIPFSIKKYKMAINPKFNCNFIKLEIESIIFLSIAKIIYMTILILKNISKEEFKNDRKSSN